MPIGAALLPVDFLGDGDLLDIPGVLSRGFVTSDLY